MKEQIYLPEKARNPYWDDEGKRGNALSTSKRGDADARLALVKSRVNAMGETFTADDIKRSRALATTLRARRSVLVIVGAVIYAKGDAAQALDLVHKTQPRKRSRTPSVRVSTLLVADNDLG